MKDRAVQLFQRIAQRCSNAGVSQASIEAVNIDQQGFGTARCTAEQRCQRRVFLWIEPDNSDLIDGSFERRPLEALA